MEIQPNEYTSRIRLGQKNAWQLLSGTFDTNAIGLRFAAKACIVRNLPATLKGAVKD